MRAEESGGSECRPVTGRTGVEEVERRHHPTRKRADFRTVLLHENNCDASTESCAEERLRAHARSGSTFDWRDTNWSDCHRRVRSLQVRIVKAWQEGRRRKAKALQGFIFSSLSKSVDLISLITKPPLDKLREGGRAWSSKPKRGKGTQVTKKGRTEEQILRAWRQARAAPEWPISVGNTRSAKIVTVLSPAFGAAVYASVRPFYASAPIRRRRG